ncbi:MAG: hypothetical protein U0893_21420 [Chloroflexota bacterium]
MSYELWDTETGNLVEAFEDKRDALRAASELIALNSDVYPAMLTLISVSDSGELATVAAGSDLGAIAATGLDGGARRAQ